MDPPENIDPRWSWHYKTLLALRENLLAARKEHRSEASLPTSPDDMDPSDRANDETEREGSRTESSAEEAELVDVDAALRRIEVGTYGICVRTGKRISAERLRAMPWTPYSREAAGRLEKNE